MPGKKSKSTSSQNATTSGGTKRPTSVVPLEHIERTILELRGQRVILDADLAKLYGVTTRRLNEQVRRNIERFPEDFMFQLTKEEKDEVVAKCDHLAKLKYSPHLPLAFTEHGAIMAANVLNSQRAIDVSVFVVRAFVRLREILAAHAQLSRKLDELERKVGEHDEAIRSLIAAIRQLMVPPKEKTRPIGFGVEENDHVPEEPAG